MRWKFWQRPPVEYETEDGWMRLDTGEPHEAWIDEWFWDRCVGPTPFADSISIPATESYETDPGGWPDRTRAAAGLLNEALAGIEPPPEWQTERGV